MKKEDLIVACACPSNAGQMTSKLAVALKAEGFQTITLGELNQDISPAKNVKGDIIALEGCDAMCINGLLKNESIACKTFLLTDYGFKKGSTKITDELTADLLKKLKETL